MAEMNEPKLTPRDLFREQEETREDVRRLHPLLSLLEEPEGSGGIAQVVDLLTNIVAILSQHSARLDQIKAAVAPDGRNPIVQQ